MVPAGSGTVLDAATTVSGWLPAAAVNRTGIWPSRRNASVSGKGASCNRSLHAAFWLLRLLGLEADLLQRPCKAKRAGGVAAALAEVAAFAPQLLCRREIAVVEGPLQRLVELLLERAAALRRRDDLRHWLLLRCHRHLGRDWLEHGFRAQRGRRRQGQPAAASVISGEAFFRNQAEFWLADSEADAIEDVGCLARCASWVYDPGTAALRARRRRDWQEMDR